jgi:hypothetical protein
MAGASVAGSGQMADTFYTRNRRKSTPPIPQKMVNITHFFGTYFLAAGGFPE